VGVSLARKHAGPAATGSPTTRVVARIALLGQGRLGEVRWAGVRPANRSTARAGGPRGGLGRDLGTCC
jgi:hypothetical protein